MNVGILKALIPPAAVPLALSLFVALAGPGGIVEINDDTGPSSSTTDVNGSTDSTDGGTDAGPM